MSILTGGIFSKPRGKMGGIVFGSARTRQGKLVTSRLLVSPSNPNTTAQQTQRTKFSSALDIVRRLGASIYQNDFNRSIGQLPGFQAMESIFLKQLASNGDLSLITPVNLGTLEPLGSLVVTKSSSTFIEVSYDDFALGNGTDADIVKVLVIAKTSANRLTPLAVTKSVSGVRSDGLISVEVAPSGQIFEVYVYVVGAGTASGLLSVAEPFSVNLA
jgi:hypothetical protein